MENMTWVEVKEAAEGGLPVVLAVGSTEQHGPHLPLATDCLLPVGIAMEAARRFPLVVAPPVRFGVKSRPLSGGGESFPGTLSISAATLTVTVTDVLYALARSGFRNLCVYNWHYENAGHLWEACDIAMSRGAQARILLVENPMPEFTKEQLDELFPQGFPGWDVEHASIMETSLMYALHAELVRRDRIVDDQAQRHPTWDVVPAPPEFIPASGVLWRPSQATPELGRKFLTAVSDRLVQALTTEFGSPSQEADISGSSKAANP